MAILEVKGLTKYFGRRKAVDDLNLEVDSGQIMGFLGPNGAGKTTTIKMIMGFLREDAGEIIINGYNLRKDYEKAMSYLGGIVENPEMYNGLTGRQNITLYAKLHGIKDKESIERVINLVQMDNRIDTRIKQYSLGMKQRIGLALALVHDPKILILDEPTNGLDPAGIRHLRDILKFKAHQEGTAVLVSSHMLSEMELLCDEVTVIDQGRFISRNKIHNQDVPKDYSLAFTWKIKIQDVNMLEHLHAVQELEGMEMAEILSPERFEIQASFEQMRLIQQVLLDQGQILEEVELKEDSLEDTYLELTKNSKIQ